MTIIAIIPARGGSKGIPRKNLSLISNIPLIGFSIKAAKKAKLVDRVLVSSDDDEIINISRDLGAEIPFKRPSNISSDTTPMIDVLKHALIFLENSGVVSVVEVPHQFNPYSILSINEKGCLRSFQKKNYSRRQDKPKFYARNGPSILVSTPSLIINNELYGDKSVPYIMKEEESLDIDTIFDLEEARRIMN